MNHAIVHKPSIAINDCELTFIEREIIDFEKALEQHRNYAMTIASLGLNVEVLDINKSFSDSVFVEDTAVILDELALITSMGSPSRRGESLGIAKQISKYREIIQINLPATLEGGDVLKVGKTLYVGETKRTNSRGIESLNRNVESLGYKVIPVSVPGCLHLKTCITALDEETFVVNPAWLDISAFSKFRLIEVDINEPWAANTLTINGSTLLNAAYSNTADKIESMGYKCVRIDISEFVKAEAGLTCLSLVFIMNN